MMLKYKKFVVAAVTAVLLPWVAPPVPVAKAASPEITVTARRREESLQVVPLSVTAFSQADLENRGIRNINDIKTVVPNLVMEPNTGSSSASKMFLRGIGEDESFFTADTPVGIYVDDVYVARQVGAMFDLFDVERVEFLRGPQGTLYGRNTTAGALKLVTRQPGQEFSASVETRLGEFSRRDFRGSVGGGINDNLSGQLAGMIKKRDGHTTNIVNGEKVNDQDIAGARGSLLWQFGDVWDIRLVADVIRERSTPGFPVPILQSFFPGPQLRPPVTNFYQTNSDLTDWLNDIDQHGLSLTVNYDFGDFELKSITAYRELENLLLLDADGRDAAYFHLYQDQEQEQYSQEFQVNGAIGDNFDYVAGIYYFHEENSQDTRNIIFSTLDAANFTLTGLETESLALFASGTWRFAERWSTTLGLRWTDDEKDFDVSLFSRADPGMGDFTPVLETSNQLKESWSEVTPRLIVDYRATDDLMVFASASKGFKSGSIDGRASTVAAIDMLQFVDPETNWTYELGVKSEWFDNRLRANVTGYFTDYESLQLGVTTAGGFSRINAGNAETKGIEVEIVGEPVEGLTFFGTLGTIDGKYTSIDPGVTDTCSQAFPGGIPVAELKDRLKLKQAPKNTWQVGVDWIVPVSMPGELQLGADYSHKNKHYQNFCNSQSIKTQDYQLLNLRVAYTTEDDHWSFAIEGNNVGDEEYVVGGFDIAVDFVDAVYMGMPANWNFVASYRY